jgi:hypothetical protein
VIYRLVHEQNGHEHVSTVVLGEHEVSEQLKAEAGLHLFGGWAVTLFGTSDTADPDLLFHGGEVTRIVMVSPKGNVVRQVWARAYDPASDGREAL